MPPDKRHCRKRPQSPRRFSGRDFRISLPVTRVVPLTISSNNNDATFERTSPFGRIVIRCPRRDTSGAPGARFGRTNFKRRKDCTMLVWTLRDSLVWVFVRRHDNTINNKRHRWFFWVCFVLRRHQSTTPLMPKKNRITNIFLMIGESKNWWSASNPRVMRLVQFERRYPWDV